MKNEELVKAPHSTERCKVSNKSAVNQMFYSFSLLERAFLHKFVHYF